MSLPTSLLSYRDCRELYEAATQDPKGARALFHTYDRCMNMRTRMHYFRKLDREANSRIYPVGDVMHGASAYDDFVVRIRRDEDDKFWIYVEPRAGDDIVIEGLSEVPALIDEDANGEES